MRKYFIAVVFLLGLTQNKSEAMNLDGMIMIKEVVEVSIDTKTVQTQKTIKKGWRVLII